MISLCCCAQQSSWSLAKIAVALHYRHGEPVFHFPWGAEGDFNHQRFPDWHRRFRRITATIQQDYNFPESAAGRPRRIFTANGRHITTYNRYTGARVETYDGDFTFYITARRFGDDPRPFLQDYVLVEEPVFRQSWGPNWNYFERTTRWTNGLGVDPIGTLITTVRHDYADEATEEDARKDMERLLDAISFNDIPEWTTEVNGVFYLNVRTVGFIGGNGEIGLDAIPSPRPFEPVVFAVQVVAPDRNLDPPLAPDRFVQSPFFNRGPGLWAGLCFNPQDTAPGGDGLVGAFYPGRVVATKAMLVRGGGVLRGALVDSPFGQRTQAVSCATLPGPFPLILGATQRDITEHPSTPRLHDWSEMDNPPRFLQVSRQPC
jgi:hypothetical protein